MSQNSKRWAVFVAVFAVWLVADLWSKHWADVSLANWSHPLPVTVSESDAGKTLSEVLAAEFGWTAEEANAKASSAVSRLEPAGGYQPGDKPFAVDGPAASARAFYVFWRGADSPPRRFDKTERVGVARWLQLARPDLDRATTSQMARDHLSDWTFSSWVNRRFPQISTSDVDDFAATGIHPVGSGRQRLTGAETVEAGQTYLVLDRKIDVTEESIKFVYAENPGAAFGFMKGLSPGLRQILFGFLTIIAFVVIGTIVRRLPPESRMLRIAFAGILAGAAGNFVDRVRYSYVIDFIDVDLGFYHWPTFNVADIAITVGVIIIVADILFNKQSPLVTKDEPEAGKDAAAAKA